MYGEVLDEIQRVHCGDNVLSISSDGNIVIKLKVHRGTGRVIMSLTVLCCPFITNLHVNNGHSKI